MTQQEYEQMLHAEQAAAFQRQRRAAIAQQALDQMPRTKYAAIVAVDLMGGFSVGGKIPWYYPEDFKWFQQQTKGHICVMGRTT
jgi:dienelactone hydrolase